MRYVYGCSADKSHARVEIAHGMFERVIVFCSECGERMKRVPQAAKHYHNPFETLAEMAAKGEFGRKANERRAERALERYFQG